MRLTSSGASVYQVQLKQKDTYESVVFKSTRCTLFLLPWELFL